MTPGILAPETVAGDPDIVADALGRIAVEAGRLLAAVPDRAAGTCRKPDGTLATDADLASERLILSRLRERWPAIPVVAEESARSEPPGHAFFLVDPLDGTRDFLSGAGEYAVCVALVVGSRPVAAAVSVPTEKRVWFAGQHARVRAFEADGPGEPARVRRPRASGLVALVSRRHGDDATESVLRRLGVTTRRTASSALKFCLVASGEADLYVRCGPTMEWDTAAGDHILTRAGGVVVGRGGAPLSYGHADRGFLNGPFAALGDRALADGLDLDGAP